MSIIMVIIQRVVCFTDDIRLEHCFSDRLLASQNFPVAYRLYDRDGYVGLPQPLLVLRGHRLLITDNRASKRSAVYLTYNFLPTEDSPHPASSHWGHRDFRHLAKLLLA